MKIAIIGQGYVGLTLSISCLNAGFEVIGIDNDSNLIENLKKGQSKLPDIDEFKLVNFITENKFKPTSDYEFLSDCDVIVIAVPTPLNNQRNPDLSYVELAAKKIANFAQKEALIINESTSFPGTLRNVIKPIIESLSDIKFQYASAPERIDPANKKWQIDNTPRVVSGLNENETMKVFEFYTKICSTVYKVSKPEVAEAAKLLENTYRQLNIALVNEFAIIADAIGFSAIEAIQAASTKPFGFMPFYPSIGVGGHCIPVDPTYLSFAANSFGVTAKIIELANHINLSMVNFAVNKLKQNIENGLIGKRIQIAGIAYKPDVSDMRESPALHLIDSLRSEGAQVTWHDPVVISYRGEVSLPLDNSVDIGLIVTPHSKMDFSIWQKGKIKIFDLSSTIKDFGWPKFF